MEEEMKSLGIEILLSTSSPLEALSILEENNCDILTTSVELEEMNGLDLIQRIRTHSRYNPIITLVTSYMKNEFILKSYDIGVDLILNKQLKEQDIVNCFQRIVSPEKINKNILIVDDSDIIRRILVRSMERSDFKTIEAESAEEALQILETRGNEILMVVSDEHMPGWNGSELCLGIRKMPSLASIPFFIMSAESIETLESLSKKSYVNSYLHKPVSSQVILGIAKLFSDEWFSHRRDFKTILPPHLQFS